MKMNIFGYSIVKRVLYELLSWKKERMEFFFKEENSLDYHNVSRWPWLWSWSFNPKKPVCGGELLELFADGFLKDF